ncbi:metabolite traffic protein EboE [Streptomyces olivochromogenes]|uniref:metabolite traffic protein EboE n=1 Tax=Streptomyces olivochromogenes TaxID=1963 RepID=UPI001F167ACB|nr:metabolite traffic protein EboE [Streptomyces olivochromogenes]MCF3131268.1 metabolite traffic protein EboE [Streptomyces olivochromogenes]
MRLRHPDGSVVHLAYCTNVHPAETLDGVLAQLDTHCTAVRERLGVPRLGIGLWLARDAAHTLDTDPRALRTLRTALDRAGLEVVTLNGFPYQGFGAEEVKYRVYEPDWADPERLAYTLALARVLAALLPDDAAEGTISTLPLAWRTAHDAPRAARAHAALTELVGRLDDLHAATGRSVRVALEPEPGCVVETCADAIGPLTSVGHARLGICVDTCHLATSFEEPEPALAALTGAGVEVVKCQLSAALHAEHPDRPEVRAALAAFDEPRFLHQTRATTGSGLLGTDDLGPALAGGTLPTDTPWRAHFHVPLHAPPAEPLTSTLPVLRRTVAALVGGERPLTRHLEVETYTWQALPPALRPRDAGQLADGIAAELALARDLLTDHGLKELP